MHNVLLRSTVGGIVVIVGLALSGCGDKSERRDSTAVRPDSVAPSRALPATSNAATIAEAESLYMYGSERPQQTLVDRDFPGPVVGDDSLPRMWIATATLKDSTTRPATRIIARIRSERAYPQAGIDSGYNYVWRSSWDTSAASSWQTKIISHDPAKKAHLLTRDPRKKEYSHGNAREPRLLRVKVHSVAFGACFDDPMCPTGHCGYY